MNDFTDLYTVSASGAGLKNLTKGRYAFSDDPSWAPDGTKLAFQGERVVGYSPYGEAITESGIYLINPDGRGRQRIQGTDSDIQGLDWQALP
jgi:Tol biopolymer transport system component